MKNDIPKQECNEKLLNALYYNVRMAIGYIEDVLTSIKDSDLQSEISKQHGEYSVIAQEIKMLAKASDIKLEKICILKKIKSWAGVKIGSIINCSNRHFAHMMYIGTCMGIPDIIFAVCDHPNADQEIKELAEKLKIMEEQNVHKLKKYLCVNDKRTTKELEIENKEDRSEMKKDTDN